MTHSGGKLHATGDMGQRFEVTYLDGNIRKIFCWTDDPEFAKKMSDNIDAWPSMQSPKILDRQALNEDK